MIIDDNQAQEVESTPFYIATREEKMSREGYFRPSARVVVTPALRTSGFWAALPGEELKSLLLMLTFVSPNGWCRPSIQELSHAMGLSEAKARSRMERLARLEWQGQPVVHEIKRESGMDAYATAPSVVAVRQETAIDDATVTVQPIQTAGRDAVVAHSREHYARPRAEVEREMAILNGWPLPEEIEAMHQADLPVEEDPQRAGARRRLLGLNVPREEVDRLLSAYPIERILQQLLWLPSRNAKSKGRFIVAAIDGDYEEPRRG